MESKDQKKVNKKEIYYDGSCQMCSAIIGKVEDSSKKENFEYKDIKTDELPSFLIAEQVEKEIYVVDSRGKVYKNVEAIFEIIKDYPGGKFLSFILSLPLIKQFCQILYKIIAVNRHFIFGSNSRIFWLKIVLIFGLMSGLFLSINLWVGERFFPYVPILNNFLIIPSILETLLFYLLIVFLFFILIFSKPQKIILISSIIIIIFGLADQMRWQPWLYQYFFMLIGLGLFSWNYLDKTGSDNTLNTARIIVSSIYFFSGLQKINIIFMDSIFPWMLEPFFNFIPKSIHIFFIGFGIVIPFIEIAIAIGLLTKKYRNYSVLGALLMHIFILFSIGPFGHSWNSIVWPWNVTMMLFVIILFWKVENLNYKNILSFNNFIFKKIVIIFFVIMPFFSFFNLWDSYLSSALYSGNINQAQIIINSSVKDRLPQQVHGYIKENQKGDYYLDIFRWAFVELNVPPYPENRIYKSIFKDICQYADLEDEVTLNIKGKPTLFNKGQKQKYHCLSV